MRHSPESPDAELVLAIRSAQSDSAFSVLYDRHTPRVFQTAWRILGGNTHAAEDAIQEAWVRAVGALDSWRGGEGFGAWLRGIAAHVAIDMLRRERHLAIEADVDVEVHVAAPELSGEQIDLEDAIAALPPGYRAVLVLHDIEGFTHEEIAAQLGITSGTSKGQLFKARRAVRARLSPPGSAAEQAGIREGDILQSIDGVSVLIQAGAQRLAKAAAGDEVRLAFERDGKPFAVALVLGQPTGAKGGPTKIINGYLALQGSARGNVSIEIWSDDPIIARDSTDTIVLRIGTGTLIKMRLDRSASDTSGANDRGSSSKKRP